MTHDHPEPAGRGPDDPEEAAAANDSREVHEPQTTDSAGHPWAGRSFDSHPNAYAGDDGAAPERLIEALRRFAVGEVGQADVVEAVRDARLLVPLVAHAGETVVDDYGRTFDKTQELSLVTVQAPDGRTALPAFTSTEAMARWNTSARPIPTAARRVALAAAGEGTDLLVLDPRSPTEFAVRRPALWAIAQDTAWRHPVDDPLLVAEFTASVAPEPAVASVALRAGDPLARLAAPEVTVELTLHSGLQQQALDALLTRLQARWSTSELIAARIDFLAIRLAAAR